MVQCNHRATRVRAAWLYNPAVQRSIDHHGWLFGLLVALTALVACWLATHVGPNPLMDGTVARFLATLVHALPVAVLWMVAAHGWGWPLRSWLAHETRHAFIVQLGLGICTMPVVVMALGTLGVLQIGGSVGAWAIVAAGVGAVVAQVWLANREEQKDRLAARIDFVILAAVPAIAVMLVAATSAPGWLWQTEFGGYDALSYHLQLPKEWATAGAIEPLQHNMYSFLPSYVEGVYYHVRILSGEGYAFIYTAQLLHTLVMCVAGVSMVRLALEEQCRPALAALAGVVLLATPWIVVVGSLAYDEGFVVLALVTGLLISKQEHLCTRRKGLVIGLLIGAACGAKLTAAGFVALPLLAMHLWRTPRGSWLSSLLLLAAGSLIALGPYLVRNGLATGNPVFPFLTEIFGQAHFTTDQIARWQAGHSFHGTFGDRITAIWNQLLRYGFGAKPTSFVDVWRPQWSILWWFGGVGFLIAMWRPGVRRFALQAVVILAINLAFWLLFTHLKSRFLIPAAVPLALLTVFGIEAALRMKEVPDTALPVRIASAVVGLALAVVPVHLFLNELQGAPASRIGLHTVMTGERFTSAQQAMLAEQIPSVYLNSQLSSDANVLMVGEAAPLYYDIGFTYTTTWDRGPFEEVWELHRDNPQRLIDALRARGFTHVLLDMNMLHVWDAAGSRDPDMPAQEIAALLDTNLQREQHWPARGVVLYRIPRTR